MNGTGAHEQNFEGSEILLRAPGKIAIHATLQTHNRRKAYKPERCKNHPRKQQDHQIKVKQQK